MHDYMICIDESGSPYLAHALFGNRKGGQKKDHKWYARENIKGSWRYWYDPESYRKWASGAVNKVKSAATNAIDNSGIKQRKALSEANNQTGLLSGLKRRQAQNAYNKTAMGRAEKAVQESISKIKESVKPMSPKARQTIGRIHEKFKDVTLDVIGPIIDPKGNESRKNLKYFDNDMDGFSRAVYGLFGARAINENSYKSSKLASIERFLDSPIAELHNKKYQQYAWQAGTTDLTNPKEIFNTAKKAWGERVKRDQARAKSMQRRGVSPQRMLR